VGGRNSPYFPPTSAIPKGQNNMYLYCVTFANGFKTRGFLEEQENDLAIEMAKESYSTWYTDEPVVTTVTWEIARW